MTEFQLPLKIQLNDSATFDNFVTDNNEELLNLLSLDKEPFVFCYSSEATGKTHIMQALCHAAVESKLSAFYIPLSELSQLNPEMLEGLEQYDVICIDDIQCLAGHSHWERALFNLYNQIKDSATRLRVTANVAPGALAIQLQDLLSRLQSAAVYQLHSLSDDQKIVLLQKRARMRGFSFPEDVARYVVTHSPRDMHSLLKILDCLDDASLQEKRLLTIPFVKKWLPLV